jgi:DNA-binding LacI/PurR family transcriptional regulator
MKITIHDVAKQAGVSTKTVSRVINHQGEISEETRARVQAVIDRMGYRPNILARSLVHQRSHMLGVVTWGLDLYAPSRIVVGIERRSRELGYSLFLHLLSDPAEGNALQILDTLAAHRVDGIIYALPEISANHNWIQPALLENLPPLVFMNMQPRPGLISVSVDNRLGGWKATRHLIEQGCRRIGIVGGPAGWWESSERLLGWREALQQAGMEICQDRIVEADWSVEGGLQAMQTLLNQAPDIDGVFACSDDIALGALTAAAQKGRNVPGDLALAGFDNIPQAAYYQPPLTTIHQPLARVGRAAVDLLHQQIEAGESETPGTSILQEPELIVRASTRRS